MRRLCITLALLIAGCAAVQVGTANFVDPGVYERILAGLSAYLARHGLTRLTEVVGTLQMPGAVTPDPPPGATG